MDTVKQRKTKQVEERREEVIALPANEELERELIRALFANDSCAEAFENLDERDFHGEVNRLLFSELKAAWIAKQPYQSVAVLKQWLESRGSAERLKSLHGGEWTDLLACIIREGGVAAHIGYYCRELRKLRKRRAAALASYRLVEIAHDGTVEPKEWAKTAREYAARIEKGIK